MLRLIQVLRRNLLILRRHLYYIVAFRFVALLADHLGYLEVKKRKYKHLLLIEPAKLLRYDKILVGQPPLQCYRILISAEVFSDFLAQSCAGEAFPVESGLLNHRRIRLVNPSEKQADIAISKT